MGKIREKSIIKKIENLGSQICFPITEALLLCNWVRHKAREGYAVLSESGRWIPVTKKTSSSPIKEDEDAPNKLV